MQNKGIIPSPKAVDRITLSTKGDDTYLSMNELAHLDVLSDLINMYSNKNADYGDSAYRTFLKFGMMSYFIRMSDKMNRLETLIVNDGKSMVEESVEDTLMDLANYCVMAVMDIRKVRADADAHRKDDKD